MCCLGLLPEKRNTQRTQQGVLGGLCTEAESLDLDIVARGNQPNVVQGGAPSADGAIVHHNSIKGAKPWCCATTRWR